MVLIPCLYQTLLVLVAVCDWSYLRLWPYDYTYPLSLCLSSCPYVSPLVPCLPLYHILSLCLICYTCSLFCCPYVFFVVPISILWSLCFHSSPSCCPYVPSLIPMYLILSLCRLSCPYVSDVLHMPLLLSLCILSCP